MKRREFITILGGTVAWPFTLHAQQPTMPVVGFLHQASRDTYVTSAVDAFRQGLKQIGYVEGDNVTIEFRWAETQYERLPSMATDLVRRQVDVIVAAFLPAALAAKSATADIPIVFISGTDPVESGLVRSLNRPAGNITGVAILSSTLAAKRLELLREVVPQAAAVAVLLNPANPNIEAQLRELRVASSTLGQKINAVHAKTKDEIDRAFATLLNQHTAAVLVGADSLFTNQRDQIVGLATRHRLPAIFVSRDFAAIGGLMSYGAGYADAYRLVGNYAGRVLKGEKPADLPIQQSTVVELVINLKTAKALGLTIPPSLLARADELIE